MGKFGKKHSIDLNPLNYSMCIIGESGIGKTTLCYELCEKLVGDNYIHFDIGRENGADAIEGIISEKIPDYDKMIEVVDDIVENKEEDYPELKVIIWDTLDELIPICEAQAVKFWNRRNPDKKADTILGAWGGFGRGQDKAIDLFLDAVSRLKQVGINSIIVAHVKRSDIIDPLTQETYSKLTADTQQRYFNAVKNKVDLVALAYIDRNIVTEKTGRKDIKGKDITINRATSEARVLSFRDDTFAVDSKSRFSQIVDRVPLNSDAFITAVKDAILAEKTKNGKTIEEAQKEQTKREADAKKSAKKYSEKAKVTKSDPERNLELISIIQNKFADASDEVKTEIKKIMSESGFSNFREDNIPTKPLEEIVSLL